MIGLLIGELVILFFLSQWLTKALFDVFLLCFRSRSVSLSMLLFLLFPGTVVHELSHLFTAEILRVPTGKLTLVPEIMRDNNVRSGSVMIGESDPFRRYAIGLAPLFWGIIVLAAISYFLPGLIESVFASGIPFWENVDFYWLLVAGYALFAVSNSMFSSAEDLAGFVPFALVIGGIATAAYFYGLRFTLTGAALDIALNTLGTLTRSLGIVLGVNIVLLLGSWGLKTALSRLTGLTVTRD